MSHEHVDSHQSLLLEPAESNGSTERRGKHWSGRLIWVSALLLAVVVSRNGWEAYQQHQRMRAVRCDEPVFDFGRAFVGGAIDHTFHVTNVSRRSLEIEKVEPSCGCTTVATELAGTSIGPGQSFDVPVRLALSGIEKGEFQRPVVVRFAGEPRLQLKLKLKGLVENRWTWSTETVIFDGIHGDEATSRTIELTLHPDAPPEESPQILAPVKSLLRVDVENASISDGGASHRVTITTVPPLLPGRRETTLYAYSAGSSTGIPPVRVILIVTE